MLHRPLDALVLQRGPESPSDDAMPELIAANHGRNMLFPGAEERDCCNLGAVQVYRRVRPRSFGLRLLLFSYGKSGCKVVERLVFAPKGKASDDQLLVH
jgi:hypothetical protein